MLLAIKRIFLELWRGREDGRRTKRSLDSLESVLRERNIEMEGERKILRHLFVLVNAGSVTKMHYNLGEKEELLLFSN